jgi:hypothetical protein
LAYDAVRLLVALGWSGGGLLYDLGDAGLARGAAVDAWVVGRCGPTAPGKQVSCVGCADSSTAASRRCSPTRSAAWQSPHDAMLDRPLAELRPVSDRP